MRTTYTSALVPRARELRHVQTPAGRRLWHDGPAGIAAPGVAAMPVHGCILDLRIHSRRLTTEPGGALPGPPEAQTCDAERTRTLEAAGPRVLRSGPP